MARFTLTGCHVFPGNVTIKAGKTIADSVANAQAGDYVVPTLSSSTLTADMWPLDASATTMRNGSPFVSSPQRAITGRGSID
jgi:hypothetical protein